MQSIEEGDVEAHGIVGRLNPSDILTKGLDGPTTTIQRQDLLGITLMNKKSGVTIPSQVKFKPVLTMTSYQAIMKVYADTLTPISWNYLDTLWENI